VDLQGFEMFANTGLPIQNAAVNLYSASLNQPNPNSVLQTVTTDAQGKWSFTGLTNADYDVEVVTPGIAYHKWYKGLVKVGVGSIAAGGLDTEDRQVIVNGDFAVWQANTTGSTDGQTICDFWRTSRGTGGAPAYTVSRQSHTLGELPGEPEFFLRFTQSALASSTNPTIEQRVENVRTLSNGQVTMAFWARVSSGTLVVTPRFTQNFGSGGSPSASVNTDAANITLTTTWTFFICTVTLPAVTGKTVGSTPRTSFLSASLVFPLNVTFTADISRCRIRAGVASSPKTEDFDATLLRCLTRYRKSYVQGTFAGAATVIGAVYDYIDNLTSAASRTRAFHVPFHPPMRSDSPTVVVYDTAGTAGKTTMGGGSMTASILDNTSKGCVIAGTDTTTTTTITSRFHYTADANL
jgi:hypothetical protein